MALIEDQGEALDELKGALDELDKAVEAGDMDAVTALKPTLGLIYGKLVGIHRAMKTGKTPPVVVGLEPERHGGDRIVHD
jgi:hypothetical protein